MTAILRDLELEDLIVKGIPEPKEVGRPTTAEAKVIAEMTKKDAKARTRIELAVGDSEMIHLLGATTAKAMWDQLRTVKETRGVGKAAAQDNGLSERRILTELLLLKSSRS